MRKRKLSKGTTSLRKCTGGPYDGMKLRLSDDTKSSTVFSCKGQTGRYTCKDRILAKFTNNLDPDFHWQPVDRIIPARAEK